MFPQHRIDVFSDVNKGNNIFDTQSHTQPFIPTHTLLMMLHTVDVDLTFPMCWLCLPLISTPHRFDEMSGMSDQNVRGRRCRSRRTRSRANQHDVHASRGPGD